MRRFRDRPGHRRLGVLRAHHRRAAATQLGLKVTILDRRHHIGGNAYSETDPETGIEVHRYGAHLFHTSNERVWEYVNRFTAFTGYQHRVWTQVPGQGLLDADQPRHINRSSGRRSARTRRAPWSPSRPPSSTPATAANLEEKAISLIGRPLYEAFISRLHRSSSGRPTPGSCRPRSSPACRCATRSTTATSTTPTRDCPSTATPRGSSGWPITRTSTSS